MNTTVQIQAPAGASRALRAKDVRKVCRRAASLLSRLFSTNACYAVMGLASAAVWFCVIAAPDMATARSMAAAPVFHSLPWMVALAIRSLAEPMQEGGEL